MKTTPDSQASGAVEVLRHQARWIGHAVRLNTRGLSHEDTLVQPEPAGNCLNWVLGHLVATNDLLLDALGRESLMEEGSLSRYARGTPPLTDGAEALPLEELLEAWDEGVERLRAALADLNAEDLARPAPFSPGNDPDETVFSLLATTLFHQGYHAGQTGLLRRIAGKEGAIP